MTKTSRIWAVVPASAFILAGCGIHPPHHAKSPAPKPVHHTTHITPKAKLKPHRKSHATASLAPKVGTTTVTKKTVGDVTTVTKTVVVGSKTTSIMHPTSSDALPTASYTIGEAFRSTGPSALTAFDALWSMRHRTPPTLPVAIQVVSPPWLSGTQWAVVPEAIADPTQGGPILWFGESNQSGHWTWIPDNLAGQIPSNLPVPLRDSLQWAVNLAMNASGPHGLLGPSPWSAVTGRVRMPVGWTMQASPAGNFGSGSPAGLIIQAWDPSIKYSHLYFSAEGVWTAANAATGKAALLEIWHAAVPLHEVLAPPPA